MSQSNYELRLLRTAEDDLTEIVLYVAADRPAAAEALADRFAHKIGLLADNPHLGSVPKEDSLVQMGYRYLAVDNNLIFYLVEARVIYVHHVIHRARDYTNLI
jgi:toxin ParE1/3/4